MATTITIDVSDEEQAHLNRIAGKVGRSDTSAFYAEMARNGLREQVHHHLYAEHLAEVTAMMDEWPYHDIGLG